MAAPSDVLDFWFGARSAPDFGQPRELWFRKSAATDGLIRTRFAPDVEAALRGERDTWCTGPRDKLALILLLDQFTRNIFRDTPRAFAGDAHALALARAMVAANTDLELAPVERWFAYLPFEHSEVLADQRESVRLYQRLADDGLAAPLEWARKHHDVIARFGRFPHRNEILARASTAAEAEFLQQPGTRF